MLIQLTSTDNTRIQRGIGDYSIKYAFLQRLFFTSY